MFEIETLLISGNYYEPLPTQYEAGNNIEEENEKMTDQLKDKIHVLKSVSFAVSNTGIFLVVSPTSHLNISF